MTEPRRTLDKHEAVRHLIHTAIRLITNMEDPFAIHVLVHSADKLLIDVANKRGRKLRVDWESYVKPEFRKQFFAKHRALYNYLKHAKEDVDDDLPVNDIMRLNVMTLFICVANYFELFGEMTNHMTLLMLFAGALAPELINPTEIGSTLIDGIQSFEGLTPKEMFAAFKSNIGALPKFAGEASNDIEDIIDFFITCRSENFARVKPKALGSFAYTIIIRDSVGEAQSRGKTSRGNRVAQ